MDAQVAALGLGTVAELQQLRDGVLFLLLKELGDPSHAEDLCNETFRIALERLSHKPLEDPERLGAFLSQTARNLVIGERRRISRRRTDTGRQQEIEAQVDPREDSLVQLESESLAKVVRQVLLEFPYLRDREILVRAYLNDQDPEQICRELGIAPETYRKVIHRARERFRSLVQQRLSRRELWCFAFI